MEFGKVNPVALGATVGTLAGLVSFVAGLAAFILYTGKPITGMMGAVYIPYSPSLTYVVLGTVLVAINSFIGCYIAAWVYNFLIDYM